MNPTIRRFDSLVHATHDGRWLGDTRYDADIMDAIAVSCPATRIVLLHGAPSQLFDVFELVRMHAQLILDLSFTILRYAKSSLDADMRFVMANLDQRVSLGSDFPEYT